MRLLAQNGKALKVTCPYCHAKAGERCKVIQGNVYTTGTTARDGWGRPLVHEQRLKVAQQN